MTPEEYSIIRDVFARIRAFPAQRDDQARAAVDAELRANPDAGIGLIQLAVGLEAQRGQLQAERDRLAAQLSALQRRDGAPSGGLFARSVPNVASPPPQPGPWGQAQAAPPPPPPPPQGWAQQAPAQPWVQAPQAQQPTQGGNFLRSALGAATGVAGGLFAYDALRGLFGGHTGMGLGSGLFGNNGVTEVINETNYVDGQGQGGYDPGGVVDGGYDDSPSVDDVSFDSDFGGGDDSSFA
ncbi:MAG: DUF2076 family protein [Ancalomicrobiaceae bacterium]|nr:DUF2076 family protein [Ancalomicrobiaceae bacterium]